MTYQTLRRYLWPHTLVPIGIMILIDYIKVFAFVAEVLLAAYTFLQFLAAPVGFVLASLAHFSETSHWGKVFDYNLMKFFPLAEGGRDAFKYVMTEREPKKGATDEATSSTELTAGVRDAWEPRGEGEAARDSMHADGVDRAEAGGPGDGSGSSEGDTD